MGNEMANPNTEPVVKELISGVEAAIKQGEFVLAFGVEDDPNPVDQETILKQINRLKALPPTQIPNTPERKRTVNDAVAKVIATHPLKINDVGRFIPTDDITIEEAIKVFELMIFIMTGKPTLTAILNYIEKNKLERFFKN